MNTPGKRSRLTHGQPAQRLLARVESHAIVATLMVTLLSCVGENAYGQRHWGHHHHGYRGGGAIVVAPPIVPMPYLDDPFYRGLYPPGPPVFSSPPSGVRVRTPFFSLNIDPGGYVPPRVYSYGYQSYRPRYDYLPPSAPITLPTPVTPPYEYSYAPGDDGGIPDITDPTASGPAAPATSFSRGQLRRSAAMLQAAFEARGEEGDIWMDFLKPHWIVEATEGRRPVTDLMDLSERYEGVVMNPDLAAIRVLPGFATTHDLLAEWMIQPTVAGPMPGDGAATRNETMQKETRSHQAPSNAAENPFDESEKLNAPEKPVSPQAFETLPAPIPEADAL